MAVGVDAGCTVQPSPIKQPPSSTARSFIHSVTQREDEVFRGTSDVMAKSPVTRLARSCDNDARQRVAEQGARQGVGSALMVDGNQEGVAGMTLVIDDPGDPEVARTQFGRLVDAVPPLTRAPGLKDTLASWTGAQQTWTVVGVRIFALCDGTHCVVTVMPTRDAVHPLPLP
jgi:hypothetical protein